MKEYLYQWALYTQLSNERLYHTIAHALETHNTLLNPYPQLNAMLETSARELADIISLMAHEISFHDKSVYAPAIIQCANAQSTDLSWLASAQLALNHEWITIIGSINDDFFTLPPNPTPHKPTIHTVIMRITNTMLSQEHYKGRISQHLIDAGVAHAYDDFTSFASLIAQ